MLETRRRIEQGLDLSLRPVAQVPLGQLRDDAVAELTPADGGDGRVTFTYRRVGSNRRRRMELDAMEFLRRFLQHVLPSGLPKVRHYGFLSPAASVSLELVRWLIALWAGLTYVLRSGREEGPAAAMGVPTCAACGGRLMRLGFVPAEGPAVFDTS